MRSLRYQYLDCAQCAYHRPEEVYRAIWEGNEEGVLASGSSHIFARMTRRSLLQMREKVRGFMGLGEEWRASFFPTTSDALCHALRGVAPSRGDVVYVSPYVDDSLLGVLYREQRKRAYLIREIPTKPDGSIDVSRFHREGREWRPKCVICSHVNPVTGYVLPIQELSIVCQEVGGRFLLEVSHSIGLFPLDFNGIPFEACLFSAYKHLFGPVGLSLAVTKQDWDEAREINIGLVKGLEAGIDYVSAHPGIGGWVARLRAAMWEGLSAIEGVRLYGDAGPHSGIVSFNVRGNRPAEISMMLEEDYGILVGEGYFNHRCACEVLGVGEEGVVRASVGGFTSEAEIRVLVHAIKEIAQEGLK